MSEPFAHQTIDRLEGDLRAARERITELETELERIRSSAPEDGTPSGYAVMNSQGKLHSLTLFQEVAEHNAKTLNQTVVPLYRKASPTPQNGQS